MSALLRLEPSSGRVRPARFVASPNCDSRPPNCAVEVLVIHAIALPPRTYGGDYISALFTNSLDCDAHPYFAKLRDLRVSAHFLIRRDGELLQFVPTHLRAWHAGESNFHGRPRVNDFSIGIELEGCDHEPFAESQYDKLAALITCLRARYPAIGTQNIVGHSDIAPGRKTDPGPHFDWQRLRQMLRDTPKPEA